MSTLITILFLVFLEGMLSFDNAIVLAVLASELPKEQQKKALTYGIWGAIGFRALALTLLVFIIQSMWIRLAGGAYLIWLAANHFLGKEDSDGARTIYPSFWRTVFAIEMTDIAFSADSILASIAVSHEFWVVFTGGVLGIIMMRFAASLFIKLLKRFPGLETSAYLIITVVGTKLLLEGAGVDCQQSIIRDFFQAFMGLIIVLGFAITPRKSIA